MNFMSIKIYVTIAFLIWALVAICAASFYFHIVNSANIKRIDEKVDKISAKIDNPVSCNLPYWLQDKIEETYTNIVSFKCVNE